MTSATERIKSGVRRTFDNAAATFDEGGFGFFARFGERLVDLAGIAPGAQVLDVGCGNGAVLFAARRRVGTTGGIVAFDLSSQMIDQVNRRAEAAGLANIRAIVADGEDPRLGDQLFDVIVAGFSIMHFPNAPASLAQYRSMLRPGGRMCFSELVDVDGLPGLVPPDVFALLQPHFPQRDEDPRERGLASWSDTEESIRTSLLGIGFSSVEIVVEEDVLDVGADGAWLSWAMSTGLRVAWDVLDDAGARELTERVQSQLETHRVAGSIQFAVPVRYVTAHR